MVVDMIIIVLHIQIASMFIYPYLKKPEIRIRLFLGLFFIGMVIALTFLMILHFFYNYVADAWYLVNLYNFFLAMALFFFCYQTEKEYGVRMKTKNVFTVISAVAMVTALAIPSVLPPFIIVSVLIATACAFPIIFLSYLIKDNTELIRKRMFFALIGSICLILGHLGNSYQITLAFSIVFPFDTTIAIDVIARASIVVGLFLLYYGYSVDVFLEADWRKFLAEYYIIDSKRGQCLCSANFSNIFGTGETQEKTLFSGGIVGIMAMIKEFTQSKKELNVIDKGTIKILLKQGSKVTIVFVVRENLKVLQLLMREMLEEFEYTFGVFLTMKEYRDGNIEIFNAFGKIADQLILKYAGGGKT